MAKNKPPKEGDVLLTPTGHLMQFRYEAGRMWSVQHIDETGSTFVSCDVSIHQNLGQSPEVLATFHANNIMHVRLNQLRNV